MNESVDVEIDLLLFLVVACVLILALEVPHQIVYLFVKLADDHCLPEGSRHKDLATKLLHVQHSPIECPEAP